VIFGTLLFDNLDAKISKMGTGDVLSPAVADWTSRTDPPEQPPKLLALFARKAGGPIPSEIAESGERFLTAHAFFW